MKTKWKKQKMASHNVLRAAYFLWSFTVFWTGCETTSSWKFSHEIALSDIQPIGIIAEGETLWLSDVKNNRVVQVDLMGKLLEEFPGIQRPMHISQNHATIYVPEYTTDTIKTIINHRLSTLAILEKPDAPAGIAVEGDKVAIADFYNHRIIFQEGDRVFTFGKEGPEAGELYYPTDVEIFDEKIFVADAYNNRVQVFDFNGKSLQVIGDKDGIQVATGIAIGDEQLFVTDFEGNRVLVYDLEGNLLHILADGLNKPTDLFIQGRTNMYVANYEGNAVSVFKLE